LEVQLLSDPILSVQGITKSFFGVVVLKDVSIDFEQGQVHAIVGENGAGKSTLIKIISGALKQDMGEIFLGGQNVVHRNPLDAQHHGISVIHQELTVFNNLSGAENIFLGREPRSLGFIDKKSLYKKAAEIVDTLKPGLSVDTPIWSLSPAEREIIQIARALSYSAKVIIMDEPTASLSSSEVDYLFRAINLLREKKVTIIYITHRLDELDTNADKVTILKDGRIVGTFAKSEMNRSKIIFLMTGKKTDDLYYKEIRKIGDEILTVEKLSKKNSFQDIDFSVYEGEVLGITGLVGAQKTELVRSIFGLDRFQNGKIYFKRKTVNIKNAKHAIKLGIGFVPEERQSQILFLSMTMQQNLTLGILKSISRFGFILFTNARKITEKMILQFRIKPNSPEKNVKTLSGGNQQKVAIARWIPLKPKLLILDEPTRGVDVGARREIYEMISSIAKDGNAIIFVSSDITEVVNVCDRIIVMDKGKISARFEKDEFNESKIMAVIKGEN
jgi:ribose transport system ATP-binding protein